MALQPAELKLLSPERLQIVWSDGQVREYSVRELRENCPCATCIEKRSRDQPQPLLNILRVEETQPLRIVRMQPTGNYAYGLQFSDGHDTGIFTIEHLRSLGAVVER